MEFTHLLKTMQFSWKACLITLMSLSGLSLQVLVTDAADPDRQVTVYVNSGQDAKLFYHTANRTLLDHFVGYRVDKDNTSLAYMYNGSRKGNCYMSQLADFCSKRVEFGVHNDTHLRLKIRNTIVNDSGCYGVKYQFDSLTPNHKHVTRLNITLIVKEGKPTGSSTSQVSKSTEEPTYTTTSSAISHSVPVGTFVSLSSLFYRYML